HAQFEDNGALLFAPLSAPSRLAQPAGIATIGGGAIFVTPSGDALVADSAFTSNQGLQAGGAILFGTLPLDGSSSLGGGLTLIGDSFDENCTGGAGGALTVGDGPASVSRSRFTQNAALSNGCGFFGQAQALLRGPEALSAQAALSLPTSLL